jgi:hypothetical protein
VDSDSIGIPLASCRSAIWNGIPRAGARATTAGCAPWTSADCRRAAGDPDGVVLDRCGVPGDAWGRRGAKGLEMQIAVMQADVAKLIATSSRSRCSATTSSSSWICLHRTRRLERA